LWNISPNRTLIEAVQKSKICSIDRERITTGTAMSLLHLFIVSVIQGVTEFLPISSSAHLILLPHLAGIQDQGVMIDVSVHLGTLFAVIIFFWADAKQALIGLFHLLRGQKHTPQGHLALALIIATIPAVIVGLILKITGLADSMRDSVALIGATMAGFGVVLWWYDTRSPAVAEAKDWTLRQAFTLGLWQALALIPGTSRSGITITGARRMGYTRESAARISMLMSIPTIIAAGALEAIDVLPHATAAQWQEAGIATVFAGLSAFVALGLMMRLLKSVSFTPYVIYRVILGLGLIVWAYI
jgi:undecaprenyl-diphosphatase